MPMSLICVRPSPSSNGITTFSSVGTDSMSYAPLTESSKYLITMMLSLFSVWKPLNSNVLVPSKLSTIEIGSAVSTVVL